MAMNNELLLRYLSNFGSSFGTGGDWMGAVNKVTNEQQAAESQAKLIGVFKNLLSGKMPEGGSVKIDGKGVGINLPTQQPATSGTGTTSPGTGTVGTPTAPNPGSMPAGTAQQLSNTLLSNLLTGALNPSPSQLGVPASALVGLSTTDVSNALTGAMNIEGLGRRRASEIADIIYKLSQSDKLLRGDSLDRPFPISMYTVKNGMVTGSTPMTLREWQSLPQDQREYFGYVRVAQKIQDEGAEILSYEEFKNTFEQTEREKFLRSALKYPEIMKAAERLARSGATRFSIGEKVETAVKTKEALSKIAGPVYFNNPKWVDDVEKHISSESVQQGIFDAQAKHQNVPWSTFETRERIKYIEDKIAAGGGEIISYERSKDGKQIIWHIMWPNKKEGTVKYGISP